MNMVWHCFKCDDLTAQFFRLFFDQLLETLFYPSNDYLSPVFRAPDKVIIHEVNCCFRGKLASRHYIMCVSNIYLKTEETNSSHSQMVWGFFVSPNPFIC